MTTIRDFETPTTEEESAPRLGELLLASATGLREQVAVWALAEEERLLAREVVWRTLVRETDSGQLACTWWRLSAHIYGLGLKDDERAFLHLVLSMVEPHQASLVRVMELDERRLAIVLRAMIQLSGCDTLAVGTRT